MFRSKNDRALVFERQFLFYLAMYKKSLQEFFSQYDPHKHIIVISATFYILEKDFFTKPKSKASPEITISRNAGDLDNGLKLPFDLIFKYSRVDDKAIKRLSEIAQVPSDMDGMAFELSIEPFPQFVSFKDLKPL